MKRRLLFISVIIGAALAGVFYACQKQPVVLEIPVTEVTVPEGMSLSVGNMGSFAVRFSPYNATDGKIVSLESTDPSVLKVSFEDMTVFYEAVAEGSCVVIVTVGGVVRQIPVEVRATVLPGEVSAEVRDGVRTVDGVRSAAAFTVGVSGGQGGTYAYSWSVDGGTRAEARELAPGQSVEVQLPGELPLGRHRIMVWVYGPKSGSIASLLETEPTVFEKEFVVRGPRLTAASARFLSDYLADFQLKDGVSLVDGEEGILELTWLPEDTAAEPAFSLPSFLTVDASRREVGRGLVRVPFKVSGKDAGTAEVTLMNVDDGMTVSGKVDGLSERTLGVRDFRFPETILVSLGGGKVEYPLEGVVPETAKEKMIKDVKNVDDAVLKVSFDGLSLFFEPKAQGASDVTVTVGTAVKTAKVWVLSDASVQDFSLPQVTSVEKGKSFEYTFVPSPVGAVDAKINALTSSDPSVLKVSYDGLKAKFEGVGAGTATVSVTIGTVSKEFTLAVTSRSVVSFVVKDIVSTMVKGETKTFQVFAEPADADDVSLVSVVSSAPSVLEVSLSDGILTLAAKGTGVAEVKVTVGGVTKSWSVSVVAEALKGFTVKDMPTKITRGQTVVCDVVTEPADAGFTALSEVSSSDAGVLGVSFDGMCLTLRAVKSGKVTVAVRVGDVTNRYEVEVAGKSVESFTFPSGMTVPLGESREFTFEVVPSDADGAMIEKLTSSNEGILRVSVVEGLKIRLEGRGLGTATVDVTIGGLGKTFDVKVSGSLCTDIDVSAVDGKKLGYGSTNTFDIKPVPGDCYDAGTLKVVAENPAVVSVEKTSDGRYAFTAKGFGDASFTASCGSVTKAFKVSVEETVEIRGADEVGWYEEKFFEVTGDNAGWTASVSYSPYTQDASSFMEMVVQDGGVLLRNRSPYTTLVTATVTVKTGVTGATASKTVKMRYGIGESTMKFEVLAGERKLRVTIVNPTSKRVSPIYWAVLVYSGGVTRGMTNWSQQVNGWADWARDNRRLPEDDRMFVNGRRYGRMFDSNSADVTGFQASGHSQTYIDISLGADGDDFGKYSEEGTGSVGRALLMEFD